MQSRPGVDRARWAAVVLQLIDEETGGNQTRFAILVGVDRRTIFRWVNSEVDVSEESVRRVAAKLGRSAIDMLVAVGYYSAEDVGRAPGPAANVEVEVDVDYEVRRVRQTNLPPHIQNMIIDKFEAMRKADEARLEAMRKADEARRMSFVDFVIERERERQQEQRRSRSA